MGFISKQLENSFNIEHRIRLEKSKAVMNLRIHYFYNNIQGNLLKREATLFCVVFSIQSFGETTDSLKSKWVPSLVTGAVISQIAFSNWVKVGENSIAWSLMGDFKLNKEENNWIFKNQIKAQYGRAKLAKLIIERPITIFILNMKKLNLLKHKPNKLYK